MSDKKMSLNEKLGLPIVTEGDGKKEWELACLKLLQMAINLSTKGPSNYEEFVDLTNLCTYLETFY